MRELPPGPVFTCADAFAAGWTSSALRHAASRGRIVRLRRGVYTVAGADDPVAQAIGAIRAHGAAVISHRSAALVHGLPTIGSPPPCPELTVQPRASADLPRAHLYRARLRPHDVVAADGVAVTSVPRTLVDVARHRPTSAAVVAMDAALHRGLVEPGEIEDVLRFCWNWPRIRRAQRAYLLTDGRAESPLESVSRLTIRALRLPLPEPQKWIFDRFGRAIGRVDFYWDEFGVAGEADGRVKYTDNDVLTAEKDRQEALEDLGLTVVRWGWRATTQRYALRAKLVNGFERARARERSGLPRLWTL